MHSINSSFENRDIPMLYSPTMSAMLSIFIFLLCFPSAVLPFTLFNRLQLPSSITGPESLAFDLKGEGPYTGVSDGRVLKYQGPDVGFTDFAVTSPNRTKEICDGSVDPLLEVNCGRPLGLGFNYHTGDLYMVDAYLGLMVVGSSGGIATQLAAAATEGVPFRFLAGLDVDQGSGMVYFTEASTQFQLRDIQELIASNDSTGRLFRYDPRSREVRVLLGGLSVAVGVAVSRDGMFVLIAELTANRIRRFWLGGPKANTSEVFMELLGKPGNIKRNEMGEFWVAINNALGPPAPPETLVMPLGLRLSNDGRVLEVAPLVGAYQISVISEVQERNGELYVASLVAAYASIYRT